MRNNVRTLDDDATRPRRPLDLVPERAMRRERPHYAVVDIGSNSVRLVVYDELGRAPFPRFNEKSLCRLAEGLGETGELSADGFRRTVEALRRFRAIADAMGADRIDVLATEATRRASNGGRLVAAIAAETGLTVRILSGAEEAQYAGLGVISGFFRPSGLIGDMGGGSLEVAEILDDRIGERSVSLPLGALPVQALLAEHGGDEAKREVDARLHDKLPPALTEPVFYAVGGGWRALAKAHMAAEGTPVHVVHGYTLDAGEARAFAKKLWRLSAAKLAKRPGVTARRIPTLPAAALVMDRVLKRLAPERVVFSALGVREGWLYAQLPAEERELDPLVEGAQMLGAPQARVAGFGPALARWTDGVFPGEAASDRRLRMAACALSDIAWRDSADLRATESFRRLLHFPFIGIDHAERAFLAATIHARYAGDPDDPCLSPANTLLSSSARRRARILGRALQLGYRISGSVPEILKGAQLRFGSDRVRLEVGKEARVPDSEAVISRLQLLADAAGIGSFEIDEVKSDPGIASGGR
jgi:exopolyphosphatase/guanosine-5'-triphosphate,3'-diphosphate pyrophosphatase